MVAVVEEWKRLSVVGREFVACAATLDVSAERLLVCS